MRDSNRPKPTVVAGIDGSEAAINAAEWAVEEAISREVPLRLVYVIAEQVELAPLASVGSVRMEVEYGETALRIASSAVKATRKSVQVETAILRGDPAAMLIGESRNAMMVCIGSVGIGRCARAFLGSTATELADRAHCPVAIIRTRHHQLKPDSPMIVVAVNESPDNDDVVEQAMQEAQLRHAPVLALGELRKGLGDMPSEELDRRVQCWGRRHPGVKICAATIPDDIADFAAVLNRTIQLAVIGSSEADQVARLIGPHSHPIVGHAECSVLVVRS
jgi:nucleotide-binding universal stress UspA family protein